MSSNQLFMLASEMQSLQEEVNRVNEIAIDSLTTGKLRTASQEFHHALALVKELSEMKQHFFRLRKALSNQDPFRHVWNSAIKASSPPALIKKPCDPMPIDVSSSALSQNWETIASVALMYNASLVHVAAEKFPHAQKMLDLARGLLQAKLIEHSIFEGMVENKYATSVVMAIYMTYGRVILGLPDGSQKQANQALKVAQVLLQRLKLSNKNEDDPALSPGQELPRRSFKKSPTPQAKKTKRDAPRTTSSETVFDPFTSNARTVSERSLMEEEMLGESEKDFFAGHEKDDLFDSDEKGVFGGEDKLEAPSMLMAGI